MLSHFLIFPIYVPTFEYRKFSGFQKGKNRKETEVDEKGSSSLSSTKVISARGRGTCSAGMCTNNGCQSACVWSVVKSSRQQSDPRSLVFWGEGLFCPPGTQKRCVRCSRNVRTVVCHGTEGGGWVAATVIRAKLTKINHNLIIQDSWNFQVLSMFQNSKTVTSGRFCQCNYWLGGETDY